MNIIAVANQKGGVGKTTTVVNLGAALARKGKSVLCIDFDPQANLTNYVAGCQSWENTIASVMRAAVLFQPADIRETIYHSERFGFDFIPSDLRLSEADIYLATAMSRETVLRRVLEPVRQAYDYILIDCNPSLGLLLTNVLVASNQVIIPVQTQYFATQGLSSLEGVIGNVRMTLNPDLSTVNITNTDSFTPSEDYTGGITGSGNGTFIIPLASYSYISCHFGEPDGWTGAPHGGMDFAAGYGTPIYAAADGVVVKAGYHNSWGNYVKIYHGVVDGNQIYTLYAHCSSLGVSAGQTVTQGQTIAAVGSTGDSTGNHLHFEVYVNNTRVAPENWL